MMDPCEWYIYLLIYLIKIANHSWIGKFTMHTWIFRDGADEKPIGLTRKAGSKNPDFSEGVHEGKLTSRTGCHYVRLPIILGVIKE